MPFSKCIDKDPTKHPENDFYTRETCREFDYAQDDFHFCKLIDKRIVLKFSFKKVSDECNCKMSYWPPKFNFTHLPFCTMKVGG